MNYNKKTVYDVDVKGKKVLLRCDFNVPQNKETGEITSDKRIVAAIPTIRYLLDNGAAVIACSHLGKPKGEWKTNTKGTTDYKKYIDSVSGRIDIRFVKVKGHSGEKGNNRADQLAKGALGIK